MTISFEEFEELAKLDADKKNLQPGKQYYIQDTSRRLKHLIKVYKGIFSEKKGDFNHFSNVEIVVNPVPHDTAKPFGFSNKSGFRFMEVIDFNPTELEINNKRTTMNELNEFIMEKKLEPHDKTPPISFMGQDYRTTRNKFYKRTGNKSTSSGHSRSSSKRRSRSSSSKTHSSSSKKGGKKTKRHTRR
jgi:hypothetical protein